LNTSPKFGVGDGKLVQPVGTGEDYAQSLVLQPDGRILLAGFSFNGTDNDFSLVRFNADGTLDASFGTAGKVIVPIVGEDQGNAVTLQADGKIVIAGQGQGANADFRVVRLNGDGSPDSSFGNQGTALLPVGASDDGSYGLVVLPDGKLVLSGYSVAANGDFSMIRLNANGSVDASFGTLGSALFDVGGSSDSGRGVIALPDGHLLMVGNSLNGGAYEFSVIRTDANGTLDTSFGNQGKVLMAVGTGYAFSNTLLVQPDAGAPQGYRLIVAGHVQNGATVDFGVLRLNADGSVDNSFGVAGNGRVLLAAGAGDETVNATALQADGKLLIAGRGIGATNGDYAVMRLTQDGQLDTTFNPNGPAPGTMLLSLGSGDDVSTGIAVQTDGRIVVSGASVDGTGYDFSVARLNVDGSLDTRFDNLRTDTLGGAATYTENGTAVVLDADVQVDDIELDTVGNYGGASLTLMRVGGANAQDLFSGSGSLGELIEGQALVYDGNPIGAVTTNSSGALVLSLDTNATKAQVDQALRSIAYSNASDDPPASVQIRWTFNDGNTGAQGAGGALNAIGTTTVTIAPVNDAPVATEVTSNGLEDTTIPVVLSGTDVDGTVAGYRITALPANGALYANAGLTQAIDTGAVVIGPTVYFRPEPNWNGSTSFEFKAQDNSGDDSANNAIANVSVDPVNDAPGFGGTLNGTAAFTERGAPVILDSGVAIADIELTPSGDYAGASLTLARQGAANAQDVFSAGTAPLAMLVEGNPLVYDGTTIGLVAQNSAGILTLSFNAFATQTLVDDTLRGIAYLNSSVTPPASVMLAWTLDDGNAGSQGAGGPLSTTGTTLVTITSVNDAPQAIDTSASGLEDAASVAITLAASDPDGTIASYRIVSLPANGGLFSDPKA
jgi:uncharacterized delta-60 repeat protein